VILNLKVSFECEAKRRMWSFVFPFSVSVCLFSWMLLSAYHRKSLLSIKAGFSSVKENSRW
jgi:hypothetical protein